MSSQVTPQKLLRSTTSHISHLTSHFSHLTSHISHLTSKSYLHVIKTYITELFRFFFLEVYHMSHLTFHISHLTSHISIAIYTSSKLTPQNYSDKNIWRSITSHISHLTSQISHITSHITKLPTCHHSLHHRQLFR